MIHEAGPLVDWVQRCTRCDVVICDYSNAAWPEDQPAPSGFDEGAHVFIEKVAYMTQQWVTEDPPDCERVS